MIIVVCGGRQYRNKENVFRVLDEIHAATPITQLRQGGATGADALAHQWAIARGVTVRAYPAMWRLEGRAAGPLRNARMLLPDPDTGFRPAVVLAFPGGTGTGNMLKQAGDARILVRKELV